MLRSLALAFIAAPLLSCDTGPVDDRSVLQLAAFSGTATLVGAPQPPEDYVVFTATLQRCSGLASDLQAVLNDRPMELETFSYDGCPLRSYRLAVHRSELEGQTANGLLVFRRPGALGQSSGERLLVEAENLWAWRGFVPGPGELTELAAGQHVDFLWSPATDVFWSSSPAEVFVRDRASNTLAANVPATMDDDTLSITLPATVPAGPGTVHTAGKVRPRVLRCEGFDPCDVRATVDWWWPVTLR